jgi:hypothetical protein
VGAEIASLAATAAAALVGAMTTDGWQRAKEGIISLWRRAHPGHAENVAGELEKSRSLATESLAEGADPTGQVARDLIGEWQSRLARLLESAPALTGELRAILTSWGAQGSASCCAPSASRGRSPSTAPG